MRLFKKRIVPSSFCLSFLPFVGLMANLLLTGCAQWGEAFKTPTTDDVAQQLLQKSQMSDDSVVLEISIINLPSTRSHQINQFFEQLDVTRVDLDQRKAWDRNGLRVAVGGNALPLEFNQIIENEIRAVDSDESNEETKMAPRRRIQARSGKPFRIATRPVEPDLTWFTARQDGYRLGGTRQAAQTEFDVRSFAQGDGSIKLLISPEILFGEPKQVVTTSNASFRYEMKRDAIQFPDLRLEANLHLGESLVMAAIRTRNEGTDESETFGLGQTFFQGSEGESKLVVIRLAQSQKDDLFESSQSGLPLESITE